ncbi:hypothetical protein KV205_08240 [Streptomyces sp. SKN60]|uniref:DUF6397 family protein n=1 Tax=Streptomyces sp. SKN60 TaxID=2855506 RepID=UPI0022486487|nr:DUF6397 family protein [Streptomyces sp. SKN60]MCX2180516.1 hypothetical protein [Streptomyces sp. SKN60]
MTTHETTETTERTESTETTEATGVARREARGAAPAGAVAPGRAAEELELRRDEFRLAVDLGIVRTVPGPAPGAPDAAPGERARRRVPRDEIERLRAAPDFPDGLRERVRAVGTGEGAELLSVTRDRFARLARTGHFSPVRFYINRYRAVVWLYPAAELAEFALNHPRLLAGRLPLDVRAQAATDHLDWRPRNWRARRLGVLLRASDDPWVRAAAIASLLDPSHVAEVVDDPYERAHLERLRPAPPSWRPNAPTPREIADRLMVADDPDEILWHRMSLALALDEARADREAPRPGAWPPVQAPPPSLRLAPAPGSDPGSDPAPGLDPAPDSCSGPDPAVPSPLPLRGPARDVVLPPALSPAPPPGPDTEPDQASASAPTSAPTPTSVPDPGAGLVGDAAPWPVPAPVPRARHVDRWPPRPAAVTRPPGRRVRRSLLDRWRRRKEAVRGPGA